MKGKETVVINVAVQEENSGKQCSRNVNFRSIFPFSQCPAPSSPSLHHAVLVVSLPLTTSLLPLVYSTEQRRNRLPTDPFPGRPDTPPHDTVIRRRPWGEVSMLCVCLEILPTVYWQRNLGLDLALRGLLGEVLRLVVVLCTRRFVKSIHVRSLVVVCTCVGVPVRLVLVLCMCVR